LALHPSPESSSQLLRTPPGPGTLVQSAIDPLVATLTLAGAASWYGGSFDGACLILALLVFAMTFPGSLARGQAASAGALALDIVTGWLAIVGLLYFLGWASRTLEAFDPRVILAWALATRARAVCSASLTCPFSRIGVSPPLRLSVSLTTLRSAHRRSKMMLTTATENRING
jgi:hypothetical protein